MLILETAKVQEYSHLPPRHVTKSLYVICHQASNKTKIFHNMDKLFMLKIAILQSFYPKLKFHNVMTDTGEAKFQHSSSSKSRVT